MISDATIARANAFVEFDLLPAPLRLWDGAGLTQWDGKDWIGTGELLSVSGLGGVRSLVAEQVVYRLSGLSLQLADQIAGLKAARRRPVTLWLVVFDKDGLEIKKSVIHKGRIDTPSVQRSEGSLSFEIPVETAFVGANRIPWNLFTGTDQRQMYDDDRAFEYVATLNGKRVVWP